MIMGQGAVGWLGRAGLPARLVSTDGEVTAIGGWPEEASPPLPSGTGSEAAGARLTVGGPEAEADGAETAPEPGRSCWR